MMSSMHFRWLTRSTALAIAPFALCLAQIAVPQNTVRPKPSNSGSAKGPSLAETTAWIKGALATYGQIQWSFHGPSGTTFYHVTQTLTTVDGCTLTFDRTYTLYIIVQNGAGTHETQDSISVNLKDLDPASGRAGEQPARSDQQGSLTDAGVVVWFQTTNLAETVEVESTTTSENDGLANPVKHERKNQTGVDLRVNSKDAAARLMKGMSHAIELCGGKKSATF